jgi:Big-like domain-containing protein
VKTAWQAERGAFARALRAIVVPTAQALRNARRITSTTALACATLLLSLGVAQAQTDTTTSLTSSAASTFGQPITFTATVSPAMAVAPTPTGTVTFFDGSTPIGTGTLMSTGSGVQATLTISTLTAGSHTITATYGGDGNFNGSSSGPLTLNIFKAPVGETGSTNPGGAVFGDQITFQINIIPSKPIPQTPTGTVTFFDGSTQIGSAPLVNGTATFTTTTPLAAGNHTITENYSGDDNFDSLSVPVPVFIKNATTTALASSLNPSALGQSVTLTATVSSDGGTPTGSVTFMDAGAGSLGTVTLSSGQASLTIATLAAGNHFIQAAYSGDSNFGASTGALNQGVRASTTTTTVTSSANPSAFGQSVTFTATVSSSDGTPTGSVRFADDVGGILGTVALTNVGGAQQASLTVSTLAIGSHNIQALYLGDNNFGGSGGAVTQIVNKFASTTALVSSLNPSSVGQAVTFTATVSGAGGTPTGSVTFIDTTTSQTLGTVNLANVGGAQQAAFTTSSLTAGSHIIQATYGGDSNFGTSSATVNQGVGKIASTTTLVSSQNPSAFGQSVTFTATVSGTGGTPSGSVTFTDQTTGQTLGTVNLANVGGAQQAAFTTSALGSGGHTIQASYGGDATFTNSAATLNQSVGKAPSTTTLTSTTNPSTFGQSVTFTATVSSAANTPPTGSVIFTDQTTGQTLGTVNLVNVGRIVRQAAFTISTLATGTHTIQASYGGDTNTDTSSATLDQVVKSTTSITTLTSSANPSVFGQAVVFTATVSPSSGSGAPTGTVTFTDQTTGQALGSVTLSNVGGAQRATLTATLAIGSHTIQASYGGDLNFGPSSATLNQVVGKAATTTALTSSPNPSRPGQAVTFTATVKPNVGSGIPTGTVTFKDNGTTIGTGTLTGTGTATFTTTTLALGTHPITAVYGGDGNFTGSTSAVLNQSVTNTSDSVKLHQLIISATPIIAQGWGQAVTGAMGDAISAGFTGNPQSLSPAGTGFTYYFNDDPPARAIAETDQDSLRRYLASPNGSLASPDGSANSNANSNAKRVGDDFRALGYAGGIPTKAPPPAVTASAPHDWLAWVTVRGFDFFRGTFGNDLKGTQVDAFAGLTRRITPNFIVGVLGGYEHFDYSSQAFNGVLKGGGWTAGAFLGWKLSSNIRFDAGAAWSDLLANGVSGTASGNFIGTRWLVNGGLTGTYTWQHFVLEPSARVFALWEHDNAFTDSLGTAQPGHNFETGRASAGIKAVYPLAWTTSAVALSPYAGLYADYYFSRDDAQTTGLTTVPLLQGFSARATGGVTVSFAGGATLGAGGEFGGIGSANHIWTWTARGRIPF